MDEVTIILEPKLAKKAHLLNAILHANAAVVILSAALERLGDSNSDLPYFALFEVVIGLSYLFFLIRNIVQKHHPHSKISWLELSAAGIFFIEGMHKMHAGTNYLHWAYFLLTLIYLILGFFYGRITSSRNIKLTPETFFARLWPWQRKKYLWKDIKSMAANQNRLNLIFQDSSVKTLNFINFLHAEQAITAIQTYFQKRNQQH